VAAGNAATRQVRHYLWRMASDRDDLRSRPAREPRSEDRLEVNAGVTDEAVSYDSLSVPGPRATPLQEAAVDEVFDERAVAHQSDELETLARRSTELLEQLQAALVPRARIDERWGVAWRYRPSDDRMRIGGDFLGVLERRNGSLALLIGDVSGRGAAAAGLGATLRSAWLATIHAGISTSEIPVVLDRLLEHHTNSPGAFATACFVEIDPVEREVRAVSAGHDPPLLITPQATTTLQIDPGPALGFGLRRNWPLVRAELPSPGALLLYTDGLTESRERPGVPRLGIEGLVASVDGPRMLAAPPGEALHELLDVSMAGSIHELDDDLALMLVAPQPQFVRDRRQVASDAS
jgi:serine phosphatase RsbU (regulator of sigma subunit)